MRSVGMSDCNMSTTRIRDVTDIKPPFLYRSCLNEFRMSRVSSVMSTGIEHSEDTSQGARLIRCRELTCLSLAFHSPPYASQGSCIP